MEYFGYDSFSFLSIIITAVLAIKYLKKCNYKNLILVGVSIALSIAFRFPNIVLLPIFILIVAYQSFYLKQVGFIKYVSVLVCSVAIVYFLLVFFYFDSFFIFKQEFIKELSNTSEQHGLSKLVNTYINHFGKILGYSSVIIIFYLFYDYLKQKKLKIALYILPALGGLYFYYKYIYGSGYNARVSLFMSAIIFSMIALQLFHSYKKEKKITSNSVFIIVLLLFLFVPSMGSKSGLKYSGIFIVFLPCVYHYAEFRMKSFFILMLCILLPFAVKERFSIKFMDKNHNKLTSYYSLPKIDGILTTQLRVNLSYSIAKDYNKYKTFGNQIIFYGLNSYMYNYVLREDKIPFKTYRMDLNHKAETHLALSMITEMDKPIFFIISGQIKPDTISFFEKEIMNKSYSREVKAGYSILYPK